jgi:hypothetical protein
MHEASRTTSKPKRDAGPMRQHRPSPCIHPPACPDHRDVADMPYRTTQADVSNRRVIVRPALRCATLLGGALGATGASLSGHQIIAISTLLVTAAIIAFELWIAKRRDDVFRKVVMRREVDPAVLRALTVHEAVRSGLLSSEDAMRLLRPAPDRIPEAHVGRGGLRRGSSPRLTLGDQDRGHQDPAVGVAGPRRQG